MAASITSSRSRDRAAGRLVAAAAGPNELFATPEGVLGYRDLSTAHGKLVDALRGQARQARQARVKHETSREPS